MEKGIEFSVNLIIAFILFIFAVVIFWTVINPVQRTEEATGLKTNLCKVDADCSSNSGGSRCLIIFPGDYNFTPFCGCLTNKDCSGDFCGSNSKCL